MGFVFQRRTKNLSRLIADVLPDTGTVLDIGCGDGTIDQMILNQKPGLTITGIDIIKRKETKIPVTVFDGQTIPYPDNSFDSVLFIDVFHHTEDPVVLLREAVRVSKKHVVIKDHYAKNLLDRLILRCMDWVGNHPSGIPLTYNYWHPKKWHDVWDKMGLKVQNEITKLDLYPFLFTILFDRQQHFIVQLEKSPKKMRYGYNQIDFLGALLRGGVA